MRWNELARIMDQHFDAERCMEKIRAVYDTDRWFSYKRNLETADYCERTMREAGLVQVEKLPLRADGMTRYGDFDIPKAWHAEHGILRLADSELQKGNRIPQEFLVLADYEKMPCSLVMYTPSTPEAGVEAEVIDVSSLSSGDKNIDMEALRGKMLLVNIPVAQALAFANQVGAVGILSDFIPLIPGVRNSREEFYDDCPWMGMGEENKNQVFGFHLTPRKGDFLRELLKDGPLKLFADIKTERYDGISYTISGALEGMDPSLPEIFAYGHIYEPGANDNASGSAVLMELMETFNELIGKGILPRPKRTIRVAVGYECSGSVGYLTAHKERKRLCAAVVDMVGTENVDRARLSLRYDPLANWSFADAAMEAANRIYKEYKGQEHVCTNFSFHMGTDNVIADPIFDMPTVAMVESSAFGYHSSMDHPDRIEPEILRRNAAILGIYIYGLADADRETCSFLEQEIRNQIADRMAGQVIERRRLLWAEAGGRAIKSLEKIHKREADPVTERFTEDVPDYAMEKGNKVPVRKVQGCLCSILWDLRERAGWSKLGAVELNTLLFWADGERTLWDIALHTAVEMNKCTDEEIQEEYEMAAAFFEDLIEVSAVEWRSMDTYNNRKTPIMGWASWNCFRTDISEKKMKNQADALVSTGLSECGYTYFNMDDGFFGGRGEDGKLKFHKKRFPNGIKVIADYVHSLGLKAGIYSEGGKNTCAYYWDNEGENGVDVGLYGYEEQDLKLFLEEYGFDFIKVDWCGGQKLDLDEEEEYTKIAKIIEDIRARTGKCIVFNICRWQFPGEWATKIADSWRTGADINPTFDSIVYQLDNIRSLARYTCPGHVNDLDMMQLGNGLTNDEEKSHFAMWCMMSTPLMIGCDLTAISQSTLDILKNEELIAVNQDSACLQATVSKEIKNAQGMVVGEVWLKNLGGDDSCEKAVAFFNRSEEEVRFHITLSDIGLAGEVISVRDLWEHKDISVAEMLDVSVEKHCTKVYKVRASQSIPVENKDDLDDRILDEMKKVSYKDLALLLDNGGKLIDVRSEEEYNKFHLEGAVNLPYDDSHNMMRKSNPDKEQNLIVYCSAGKRSVQARNLLVYLGYKNVYLLTDHEHFL